MWRIQWKNSAHVPFFYIFKNSSQDPTLRRPSDLKKIYKTGGAGSSNIPSTPTQ